MQNRHRNALWRGTLVTAALVGMLVAGAPMPAIAHDAEASRSGWMEKNVNGQCTWSYSRQNHAHHEVGSYSYLEYDFGNFYTQSCAKQWARPGGHIILRAEWYRDG
jgi:hypothetical protein